MPFSTSISYVHSVSSRKRSSSCCTCCLTERLSSSTAEGWKKTMVEPLIKQAFSVFVVKLHGFCLSIAYIAHQCHPYIESRVYRLSDIHVTTLSHVPKYLVTYLQFVQHYCVAQLARSLPIVVGKASCWDGMIMHFLTLEYNCSVLQVGTSGLTVSKCMHITVKKIELTQVNVISVLHLGPGDGPPPFAMVQGYIKSVQSSFLAKHELCCK